MHFENRREAGRRLAKKMKNEAIRPDTKILVLRKNSIPVAHALSEVLEVPYDLFLVRPLRLPDRRKTVFGIAAPAGIRILYDDVVREQDISDALIQSVSILEKRNIQKEEMRLRGDREVTSIGGQQIILADDGAVSPEMLRASIQALKKKQPQGLSLAMPVLTPAHKQIADETDLPCYYLEKAPQGKRIQQYFEDFAPVRMKRIDELLPK